ncbi:hypothetical protein G432_04080 [Sphingomonas sp. MM-1]|uniref:hypothetical protein n=1 Tax=Sphingomonas sp. MM-1 TaxID=745310 RepID=UPI0002C096A9|nr:hypothetical protein [Sphingomonas sp. MM-1]AGH48543.1 hypothetical protein G432_04080 [Sphingomonas sp. MM-1]
MKPTIMILACAMLAACGPATKPADVDAGGADAAGNAILPAEPDMAPGNAVADPGIGNAAVASTLPTAAWIGKWVGVEGLALEIEPGPEEGIYALKVTLLDGTNNYVGTGAGETIHFTRDGKEEVIRKATGDETGLKYLAGKKDCLMIRQGEGFCRD